MQDTGMIARVGNAVYRLTMAFLALTVISIITTGPATAHGINAHHSPDLAVQSEAADVPQAITQVQDTVLATSGCQHAISCCVQGNCCGPAGLHLDRVSVTAVGDPNGAGYLNVEQSPLNGTTRGPETPPPRRMI